MSDFWDHYRQQKEQEERASNPQPVPGAPWWAMGTSLTPSQPVVPQQQPQGQPGPSYPAQPQQYESEGHRWAAQEGLEGAEGHNFSRAMHLQEDGICPSCNRDGLMTPSADTERHPEAQARCFFCGFNVARSIHTVAGMPASVSGRSIEAKSSTVGVVQRSAI